VLIPISARAITLITFTNGTVADATQVNQNFSTLDSRVAALESLNSKATQGGKYSVGASFCGTTVPTMGDLSGLSAPGSSYTKTKAACEVVVNCSSTAHMCTVEELYRSVTTGTTVPYGWVMDTERRNSNSLSASDGCSAYTTALHTQNGSWWNGSSNSSFNCDQMYPLLCCD
jgi:hypothetical protein